MPEMRVVILVLGVLHAVLTLLSGVTHLVLDFPLSWVRSHQEVTEEAKKLLVAESTVQGTGGKRDELGGLAGGVARSAEAAATRAPPPEDVQVHVSTYKVVWRALKRGPEMGAHAFFLVLSVLGVLRSPILIVFCLADYFRLPGGLMVFKALRIGGPGQTHSFLFDFPVLCRR